MDQILAIMRKDFLLWVRRPAYLIASTILGVLIIAIVGDTISGARHIPFGLYDPAGISDLSQKLTASDRFTVLKYDDLQAGKRDLSAAKIVALAEVSQDPLEDTVTIWTEGHNPLIDDQISMGLLNVLTQEGAAISLPLHTASLFSVKYDLRDYITPGLAAYLTYVLASMNLGFSWIYEWMERTYRQLVLAPHGLRAAIIAKTVTVTIQSSMVLWLSIAITAPLVGYIVGKNFIGLALVTILSVFCFTSIGLCFACILRTIRVYTMTVSILGVALMFVSGIIVPIEAMPPWEYQLARALPLYYAADAFKGVFLSIPADYARDFLVLSGWAVVGLSVASLLLVKRKAAL
ncbi:MAG TPA: ABC transporter permease [Candidatus Obscuribacterales bacterium]